MVRAGKTPIWLAGSRSPAWQRNTDCTAVILPTLSSAVRFSSTLITPGRKWRKRMVEALLTHCLTETLAGRECAAAGRYG